jgi:hypothetical protein
MTETNNTQAPWVQLACRSIRLTMREEILAAPAAGRILESSQRTGSKGKEEKQVKNKAAGRCWNTVCPGLGRSPTP